MNGCWSVIHALQRFWVSWCSIEVRAVPLVQTEVEQFQVMLWPLYIKASLVLNCSIRFATTMIDWSAGGFICLCWSVLSSDSPEGSVELMWEPNIKWNLNTDTWIATNPLHMSTETRIQSIPFEWSWKSSTFKWSGSLVEHDRELHSSIRSYILPFDWLLAFVDSDWHLGNIWTVFTSHTRISWHPLSDCTESKNTI